MDPLSDVLSLLKLRSFMFGALDLGGQWSFEFPWGKGNGINCYSIFSGSCWLAVEGVPDPVHVAAGDCFLLPRGLPFRLASDLHLPPMNIFTLLPTPLNGDIRTYNGGGDCFGVGGYFSLDGPHAGILLESLPPIIHIHKESDKAALRWSVERLMQELRTPQPGGFLVSQHLAQMIMVQALRLHLAEDVQRGTGWLFALSDKQIGPALDAMHAAPAHSWTVQELAERAYMSRSTFALKFKELVGTAPVEYLTRWRMLLAADRLTHSNDSLLTIALSLGYESESAFSTAFKRIMSCPPRQYSRVQKAPNSL